MFTRLEPLYKKIFNQVEVQISNQVSRRACYQVRTLIWDTIGDQIEWSVWNRVHRQVWDWIDEQVWNQLRDQVRKRSLGE